VKRFLRGCGGRIFSNSFFWARIFGTHFVSYDLGDGRGDYTAKLSGHKFNGVVYIDDIVIEKPQDKKDLINDFKDALALDYETAYRIIASAFEGDLRSLNRHGFKDLDDLQKRVGGFSKTRPRF
jgi:hypothetical protein